MKGQVITSLAAAMSGLLLVSALTACGSDHEGGAAGGSDVGQSSGQSSGQLPEKSSEQPSETSSAQEESPETSEEEVELSFYAVQEEEELFNELIEIYTAAHPNVKITAQYANYYEYLEKLGLCLTSDADDLELDCFVLQELDMLKNGVSPSSSRYIEEDDVLALDELISSGGMDVSGIRDALDSIAVDGKTYCLPYKASPCFIVYNKDIFDAANVEYPIGDWTWEEYAETAAKVTSGEGENKIYGAPTCLELLNLPALSKRATNCRYEEQLDAWLDAVEFDKALSDKGYQPGYFESQSDELNYVIEFLSGRYGMMYGNSKLVEMFDNPDIAGGASLNWDIAPLPHWEGEEALTVGEFETLLVAKKSKHPKEAFDFISFVAGAEGAELLAARGYIPVWSSDEIVAAYCEGKTVPEHSEFAVNRKIISRTPVDEQYNYADHAFKEEIFNWLFTGAYPDREAAKEGIMKRLKEQNLLAE